MLLRLILQAVGVRDRAWAADWHVRQFGFVRPLAGGHFALVCSPTGHRGRDLRVGNYLAGAIWPPMVQHFTETLGWRQAYIGVGLVCVLTLPPLAFCSGVDRPLSSPRQEVWPANPGRLAARPFARCASGASGRGGLGVLRRDVDAAGSHRRLLCRPRLWRRARSRDAVAHAGFRHRQPGRLRLHR